jgi:hypothetical protein
MRNTLEGTILSTLSVSYFEEQALACKMMAIGKTSVETRHVDLELSLQSSGI